jgi:hypothetical protein
MKGPSRIHLYLAALFAVSLLTVSLARAQLKPSVPTITVYQDPG